MRYTQMKKKNKQTNTELQTLTQNKTIYWTVNARQKNNNKKQIK